MTDDTPRITTDEERERFNAAKSRGGLCTVCGRALADGEPVYIEQVAVDRKPLTAPGTRWSQRTVYRDAPLGAECASPKFLAETQRRPPEECASCGRPVYYARDRAGRRRAICSRDCSYRATERAAKRGDS
jgi:hypothetical protein